MNTMTARGLSLALVVAVWTFISHTQNLPLSFWPVLVAAAFGMVLQTRVPLLSFTAGAFAGAGTALGMAARSAQGGVRVAIVLAIGAGLGYAAEWLAGKMRTRTA